MIVNNKIKKILDLFIDYFFNKESCKCFILAIIFSFIFTACENKQVSNNDNMFSDLNSPSVTLEIEGEWELESEFDLKGKKISNNEDMNMLISPKLFFFSTNELIDPSITARYVSFINYMSNKVVTIPDSLSIGEKDVKIFTFSDNISYTQDIIEISKDKILVVTADSLEFYNKISEIDQIRLEEEYSEIKRKKSGDFTNINRMAFGVSIGLRKAIDRGSSIDYEYLTYNIMRGDEGNKSLEGLLVKDIVIPKDSGLWTVQSAISKNQSVNISYLSAKPTASTNDENINILQDDVAKRIEYVNEDYIAVRNIDRQNKALVDSYRIYNMYQLSKKKPLSISDIAGNEGEVILQNKLKQVYDSISKSKYDEMFDRPWSMENIGIKRDRMKWAFVSNVDVFLNDNNIEDIYTDIILDIVPIVNIGSIQNTSVTWRDVINRVPSAIDASVSPNNDVIFIQNKSSIEIYELYSNYISAKPILTIQNTTGCDIVMIKWNTTNSVKGIFDLYSKLPQENYQIIKGG